MKTRMIVCGAAGRMGQALTRLIHQNPAAELHAAVEAPGHPALGTDVGALAGVGALGVTIGNDYAAVAAPDTVTLDFTSPAVSLAQVRIAVEQQAAIVVGTTGFDDAQRQELHQTAARTRSVVAPNMSVGVNVLLKLVASAAAALGDDFDPEIFEIHHRMKVDSPSGTALALGRAVAEALGRDLRSDACYGREGIVGKRPDREIGIMALRGGDTAGEHTVIFAGMGERVELVHRSLSRDCLARGAIRAALWVVDRPPSCYTMADVLGI
jgi:4-hydroxy-tetrahydrodipicolinate reductase